MRDDVARRLLAADRAATAQRVASMTADLEAVMAASLGSNADDEHDPEGSTIAFEREQMAALRSRAQDHLTELAAASDRIVAGRYGRCELCGRPISDDRLSALPATRWCVSCAAPRR